MDFESENFIAYNSSLENETLSNGTYGFYDMDKFVSPFSYLHVRVIFSLLYGTVFALCFFGNLMVLFAIVKSARLRSMTNFFLANLAVADLCVGVFCVLPTLSTFLSPYWYLGRVMCKVYYFVWNVAYTASIVILTAIATERYIAIQYPLRARTYFTLKRLIVAQAAIWTISGLYNIPYIFVFELHTIPFNGTTSNYCFYDYQLLNMKALTTVNFIVWYIFPLLAMTLMYCKIGTVLWTVGYNPKQSYNSRKPPEQEETHYTSSSRSSGESDCTPHYTIKLYAYPARSSRLINNQDQLGNYCDQGHGESRPNQYIINGNILKHKCCRRKDLNNIIMYTERNKNDSASASSKYEISDGPGNSSRNSNDNSEMDFICCKSPNNQVGCPFHKERNCSKCNRGCKESQTLYSSIRSRQPLHSFPARINSSRAIKNRRKVIRLLVAVVVSFTVCVTPHHIRFLLQYWGLSMNDSSSYLSPISFLILFTNSALNPILYALFSANFRKSFKEIVPCNTCLRRKKRLFERPIILQNTKFGSF